MSIQCLHVACLHVHRLHVASSIQACQSSSMCACLPSDKSKGLVLLPACLPACLCVLPSSTVAARCCPCRSHGLKAMLPVVYQE
jgi:hypothetical protein